MEQGIRKVAKPLKNVSRSLNRLGSFKKIENSAEKAFCWRLDGQGRK
jgi:hypothetical protein